MTTTTTTTTTIDARALLAVACAMSDEQTRYYLRGVFVEWSATHVRLTATDGIMLITLRLPYVDDAPRPDADELPRPLIIPREMLTQIKMRKGAPNTLTLTVTPASVNGTMEPGLRIDHGALSLNGVAEHSEFPDYRRILPATVSGDTAQYDAHLLARLVAARTHLMDARPRCSGSDTRDTTGMMSIAHNGDSPGVVDIAAGTVYEAIAVCMPYRDRREPGARTAVDHIAAWGTARE